jgi:cell division protein FtsB
MLSRIAINFLNIALFCMLIVFQWQVWVKPRGMALYWSLGQSLSKKAVELLQVERKKNVLESRLDRILSNPRVYDGLVRQELNWVRGGERFYQFIATDQ